MNKDTTHQLNKIVYYNIVTYLLLFFVELTNNISFALTGAKTGKVLSSLYGDSLSIIGVIWNELILYIFALLGVYIIFAWMTAKIIQQIIRKMSQLVNITINYPLIVPVFFLVNLSFIYLNYFFVSLLYPLSRQDFFNFDTSPLIETGNLMFYLFISVFFLLVYFSLKKSHKIIRNGFVIILLGIVFFNNWTQLMSYTFSTHLSANVEERGNKGPNVILLGIDSLRPDHLIRNGYTEPIAPHVEEFLGNSISYTNAHTPLARTFPSWMSILTGEYPTATGLRYNLIQRHYYNKTQPTLAELLKEEYGYYSFHAMDETRFCNIIPEDGFDEFMHPVTGVIDFLFSGIHDFTFTNLYFNNRIGSVLFPFMKNNRSIPHLYDGDLFVHDIVSKLKSLKNKDQLFLAIHLCAAHWPYRMRGVNTHSGKKLTSDHERYQEAIKIADNQLGIILNEIKRTGLYDNSIIIILSDHGESFVKHWGHGTSLYDANQNHIVLGVKPVNYSGYVENDSLVSTIDIAPTILDLLGLEPVSGFRGKVLHAKTGEDQYAEKKRSVFLETGFHLFHPYGKGFTVDEMVNAGAKFYEVDPETEKIIEKVQYHERIVSTKQLGLLTEEWRLIAQKDRNEKWRVNLFDISDTECTENMSEQYPSVLGKLIPQLEEHFKIDIVRGELDS
jgi:arylsulfatase A-like enzyme